MNVSLRIAAALLSVILVPSAALAETAAETSHELATDDLGFGASPAPCDLCDDWCPLWTLQAGAVILTRSDPGQNDNLELLEVFGGDELDFGWSAGLDVAAIRRLLCDRSLELRYFGLLDWDGDAGLNIGPLSFTVDYESQVHSTELNLRRSVGPSFAWLAGLRMIQLHEEFDVGLSSPPLSAGNLFNTDNHLYGGQLGAQVDLCPFARPLTLSGVAKAGVYANYADYEFRSTFGGSSIDLPRGDDWQATFVGELGLIATWPLTDRLSLRGGYQLLWLDGVALASGQEFPLFGTQVDSSGQVLYHGGLIGLEMAW